MIDIVKVADSADMIVNGFAFIKTGNMVRVINLNNPKSVAMLDSNGDVTETTMDDIELDIVSDYYARNKQSMEE